MVVPAYPAFNIYTRIANVTTSLGPLCVATAVSELEDWDVEVIDENNYRRYGPKTPDGYPDHAMLQTLRPANAVGLYGGLSSTIPRLLNVARFYREKGIITIAGGQHFAGDNVTEALNNAVDMVVLGEGEYTTKAILTALQRKQDYDNIPGLAFSKDGRIVRTEPSPPIADLESLPMPNFSLIRYAKVTLYPVNWTRGCVMNCEFCTVKGKPRSVSPQHVFRQIATLVEKHGARHFFLVDDLFAQDRQAALTLCSLLREYQAATRTSLDLSVQIRLDKATDTELLQAMRSAGINTVIIGFESPITEELQAMNKKLKPEEMVSLARLYPKAGFLVHGMFIFGYPLASSTGFQMSTDERVKHFRKFIRDARIDTVQVLLPVPLPGTEMTRRLAEQNRVFPTDIVGWEYYDGNFPVFRPDTPITPEEMQAAIMRIMGRFYQFRYMFAVGFHVLFFPSMVFHLHNLKAGWSAWYRRWRNSIVRFGGWVTMKRWNQEFNKGIFTRKLSQAKRWAFTQMTRDARATIESRRPHGPIHLP
jgi:radical SAM superfamily enzyme YgiQ (UPF0313 family)